MALPKLALNNVRICITLVIQPDLTDVAEDVCVFVIEHIVHFMFVPGKIENWVLIIDLEGIGLRNAPSQLKKTIDSFQNNYRARLAKMFVLNASFLIRTIWVIVEGFMDSVTRSKISMSTSNTHDELKELVLPEQLPEKYGGKSHIPESGWPPYLPDCDCRAEFSTQHLTDEEIKKDLAGNPRMLPPPELAEFARASCKATKKRGAFPHKTYYLKDRIERRDSFNGIVPSDPAPVPSPAPVAAPVAPSTVETKAPEEKKVEAEPKPAEPIIASVPAPAATDARPELIDDVPAPVLSPQHTISTNERPEPAPAPKPAAAAASVGLTAAEVTLEIAKPTADTPPSKEEAPASPTKEVLLSPEAKVQENCVRPIPKEQNKPEGGAETAGNTSNGSGSTKMQPHFGKAKDETKPEGKACCACIIL